MIGFLPPEEDAIAAMMMPTFKKSRFPFMREPCQEGSSLLTETGSCNILNMSICFMISVENIYLINLLRYFEGGIRLIEPSNSGVFPKKKQ